MLDQELRALVSVDASPSFAARVRTAISQQPSRPAWAAWWRPLLLTAGIVVLAIGAGHWADGVTTPSSETTTRASRGADVLLASSTAVSAPSPLQSPLSARRPSAARTNVGARVTTARANVQIDVAEAKALQRLFAAPPTIAIGTERSFPSASDALEIPQLSIAPLIIATTSEGDSK